MGAGVLSEQNLGDEKCVSIPSPATHPPLCLAAASFAASTACAEIVKQLIRSFGTV